MSDKHNRISLIGFINSKLVVKPYLAKTYYYLNEPVELSVLAFQDDTPIINAKVYAHISSEKTNCQIKLYDDGEHNDEEKNDGLYKNYFYNNYPGNHKITFNIKGKNLYSDFFSREEHKSFYTSKKENNKLKILPLNIEIPKAGADQDYYQSFRLISKYSNDISIKIFPLNIAYSNYCLEDLSKIIKIKPYFFILKPYHNKLFNIKANLSKEEKHGFYSGNLILYANNDFFSIPFGVDFHKYYIPENDELIQR